MSRTRGEIDRLFVQLEAEGREMGLDVRNAGWAGPPPPTAPSKPTPPRPAASPPPPTAPPRPAPPSGPILTAEDRAVAKALGISPEAFLRSRMQEELVEEAPPPPIPAPTAALAGVDLTEAELAEALGVTPEAFQLQRTKERAQELAAGISGRKQLQRVFGQEVHE